MKKPLRTTDKELARLIIERGAYLRASDDRRNADTSKWDKQIAPLMAKAKWSDIETKD